MMGRILLVEDDIDLLRGYEQDLKTYNFEVVSVMDGEEVIIELKKYGSAYFQAIVSDSELVELDGHAAVRRALEYQLLDLDKTLVFGMSDEESNQQYWRGIANYGCFYNKGRISDNRLGSVVFQCLRNFRSGGLWRERMPVFS